ncbi:zinc finger protein 883-like [Anopheles bellator]|uniref:zinc finger protein 883-like n=1 Tax=Anopheles bellator TaxID=139047 RepID=UPI00264A0B4E|nr:zinc finger protein 883-like [Anopheles bellator]
MALQHSIDGDGQARSDALHRCSNCDQYFNDAEALSVHLKQLQLKQSILGTVQTARQQVHPNLFNAPVKKCCGCLQSFQSLETLLQHTEQQHSIRKMARDPSRPAQCEICYKLFRCHPNMRFHQRVVYQPCNYRCHLCDRLFTTANKLSRHQITHDPNRKFRCVVCDATFKVEQNLKMHSLVHQEEKREVCKTCGLRFRRKSNLRMHQRTHSDTYYHACAHCDRKYKNKSQLSEHLKVHTKERPYPCRFCEKRFMYYSDWKRHETTHTGQYPYVCSCSKQFIRKNRYTQHIGKCKASVEALDNETGK